MAQRRIHADNAKRQAEYRKRLAKAASARTLPGLAGLPTAPGMARWGKAVARAAAALEHIHDEMQTYYETRTERWQESDRGEAFQERMESLEDKIANLDDWA